jgi:hypothetical protein
MQSRRLLIDHLAAELHAMESGRVPMNPLRYRVNAKMLRQTLEGCDEPPLRHVRGGAHPQVIHALANRFFEDTGHLMTPNAAAHQARSVLERTLELARQERR